MEKKKILIIDDEQAIVEALEDLFRPRGFEAVKAIRGSMGLDLAMQEKPDVVIVDLRMPGMGGEEVIKELKENLPQTKILVYTAWTGDETRHRVLEKGADLFMEKPGDFESLKNHVLQLLEQKV